MPVAAKMTSPANDSTFDGPTQSFSWSAGTGLGVFWYGLYLGSTAPDEPCPSGQQCPFADGWDRDAAYDLGFIDDTDTQTSWTANGLPQDGRKIYVRLFTKFSNADGPFIWRDYIYYAALN